MNKLVSKQRGMTAIGWLLVLGILAFFVMLVLRLLPGNLEYYKVKSVIESMKSEPYIASKTPQEIRNMLQRRIEVNTIDSITAKDIQIEQKSGKTTITADYEVRVNIMGDTDAVTKFKYSIEVVAH
jgi:hypothetical protein